MHLFIAIFVALICKASADCLPSVGNNVDSNQVPIEKTCALVAILAPGTTASKAAGVCACITTFNTTISPNCDSNTLAVDLSCAAATIFAYQATNVPDYDFGTQCEPCINPPVSPLIPAACSRCYMKYISCLTTGYFNLKTYPSITDSLSLKTTCGCLGQFYQCFNGCGSALSAFTGDFCEKLNFCACDGSLSVGDSAKAVAYLKNVDGFKTFSKSITDAASGAVLSIDCVTQTAANSGLAGDRFLCDINFAPGTINYPAFHTYVTNYLGKNAQIAVGIIPTGPVVSAQKRDVSETMVSNTYTIVMENSGAVLSATFSLVLVLGAMLVLLF